VAAFQDALHALLEVLSPGGCAGCGLPLAAGERGFCGGCALLLEPSPQTPPAHVAAAYAYGGPLAEAVLALKYAGRTELAAPLGRLLAQAAVPYAGKVDEVVPLPLHRGRLRERGFNQSALLARPVARALGVPLVTHRLRRVRPTPAQASLPREGRLANVRGAFAARAGAPRVLLIDDVRTTGATLTAAAEALLDAGALRVYALALAWA